MYAAFLEAIKVTTSAISSALQNRPKGTWLATSARRFSSRSAVISVSTKPGAMTFEVIDRLPSSRAKDRAIPTSPDLLAE